MRSIALAAALILTLAACGDDDAASPAGGTDAPSAPQEVEPSGPVVPVRVRGSVEETTRGWAVCPDAVAPCWPVTNPEQVDAPARLIVAEGRWQDDTIEVDTIEALNLDDPERVDSCAEAGEDVGTFDPDRASEELLNQYLDEIPELAGIWLTDDQNVLVVVVNDDPAAYRSALEQIGVAGVCVVDLGFEHTEDQLRSAQQDLAERLPEWADNGWIGTSVGVDITRNVVVARFDEIDQRLVNEIDEAWGGMVEVEAAVEVLDGTVDDLASPAGDPDEIPITTQPRGAGGMDALGSFVLRYDSELDCVWFEDADGSRIKPIWPFGSRLLRGAMVVFDGAGQPLAAVGQEVQLGGGFGELLPDADDRTDCGAESVWVINPS